MVGTKEHFLYNKNILPYIYILFNSLIKNYQLTQQLITFIEILFFYYFENTENALADLNEAIKLDSKNWRNYL